MNFELKSNKYGNLIKIENKSIDELNLEYNYVKIMLQDIKWKTNKYD